MWVNPAYFHTTESAFLQEDSTKVWRKLDWEPVYTLDMLIDEMVGSEMEG